MSLFIKQKQPTDLEKELMINTGKMWDGEIRSLGLSCTH